MSVRLRRAMVGLAAAVAGVAGLAALPAAALAYGEAISVTPANPQAGGGTSVSITMTFNASDSPLTLVTALPSGVLGNFNANVSCLTNLQEAPACNIGTATFHTGGGDFDAGMYVVPAQGNDAAGILLIPDSPPLNNQYVGVSLNSTEPGALVLTAHFPDPYPYPGNGISGLTLNFLTLESQPFIRLPTSCATATSIMNVTYWGGAPAATAQGSFVPTGCPSLSYAPTMQAAISRDAADSGATLHVVINQGAGDAASKSIVLALPKGLTPNLPALAPCLNGTGCRIGEVAMQSRLLPDLPPVNGTVTLSGAASEPTVSVTLPPPFSFTISGLLNPANNSVTFANVPDLPLMQLSLDITGPAGGGKAFSTDCAPADITGTFAPQSATSTVTATAPIAYASCRQPPIAAGSTGGLAGGHPKLKLTISHGKGAKNVTSLALGLPGGLSFSRSAIVSHKTCTKASRSKQAKCSTTTLISGLGVSGAKAASVSIKGGRLVITLTKPAAKLTITVAGPLVREGRSLQRKVEKHTTTSLRFTLTVTDAEHTASPLSLKLRAH